MRDALALLGLVACAGVAGYVAGPAHDRALCAAQIERIVSLGPNDYATTDVPAFVWQGLKDGVVAFRPLGHVPTTTTTTLETTTTTLRPKEEARR